MRILRIAPVAFVATVLALSIGSNVTTTRARAVRTSDTSTVRRLASKQGDITAEATREGLDAAIGSHHLVVRTARIGRADESLRIRTPRPEGDDKHIRWNRADGVSEWWRSATGGLEHGYSIATPPRGDASLRIELELSGFEPTLHGERVELRAGADRANYDGLVVRDSRGTQLGARFEVRGTSLAIVIDDRHARYPIVVDPLLSTPTPIAPASFQTQANAQFGTAVGVSSTIIVVGAPDWDGGTTATQNQGRAYVFNQASGTAYILAASQTRQQESFFGDGVAVDGERFVVGASNENFHPTNFTNEGAAYVFRRVTSTTWTQDAQLTAGAAAVPGDNFGSGLAVRGDVIAVGAPGRSSDTGIVYLFDRATGSWVRGPGISAPDAATARGFGASLALSDDTFVVGANYFSNTMQESVYLYTRGVGAAVTYLTTLHSTGGVVGERFGATVSISADIIAVGAPGYSTNQGAVYIFERNSSGVWSQRQRITEASTQSFGGAVSLSGDLVLIGAGSTDISTGTSNEGRAFMFYRDPVSGVWAKNGTFPPTAPDQYDNFGNAVALSGGVGVIGAYGGDTNFAEAGEATSYRFQLETGTPCRSVSTSICEQGFCQDGFCCGSACDQGCDVCSMAGGSSANGTCALRAATTECRAAVDACDIAEACDGLVAACPADVQMNMCTVDAGTDAGSGSDAGSDGGSGTLIPHKSLSCTCDLAGGPTTSNQAAVLVLATIAYALGRRTARRRTS